MKEVEVKVLEIDKKEMIRKLKKLGAVKVFEGEIHASHYDYKDFILRKDGAFVRLRKKGDKCYLTYKKKISKNRAKVMNEIESEIGDFDSVHDFLSALKLKSYQDIIKKRTSYKIGNVMFEIDEFKDIPVHMEIEAPSIKIIYEYVKKLGIDKSKVKNWTGHELFEHYGIKNKFGVLGE